MTLHTMDGKNKKIEMTKSQSEFELRNKNGDMMASIPNVDMTRSGII